MYKSWSGRVAVLRFKISLENQFWLGRFPIALPDQLATQAVLLANKRHLEVPAESDLIHGIGHELHPRAFRSHPETSGHHQNTLRCAEHRLPSVETTRAKDEQQRY